MPFLLARMRMVYYKWPLFRTSHSISKLSVVILRFEGVFIQNVFKQ